MRKRKEKNRIEEKERAIMPLLSQRRQWVILIFIKPPAYDLGEHL